MVPLTDLVTENGFEWRPVHEEVLAQIKRLVSKMPVLRPISHTSRELIFLFTDTFKVGAGMSVGQGPIPETAILHHFTAKDLPPHNCTTLCMNQSF
jgi:hypothetical protein